MRRCITCCLPDTKPDLFFNKEGECSACVSHKEKKNIDWDARKKELDQLLDKHNGEVLVPSSGGKDSSYQCLTLKEMGAHVPAVTARTCHITKIGRYNIDNLARHVRTIEYVPNMTIRAKLNRLGLKLVADISHPEHMAIFTTPFRAAIDLNIPLIMYGENSQMEYGGPLGSNQTREMTRRWVTEFGGFLGLRPQDLIEMEGITKRDMQDYMLPSSTDLYQANVNAHFLGQYLPWDSYHNAAVAKKAGMKQKLPSPANWWAAENLDNGHTGTHDYLMFIKYKYGRGCAQISVDVRRGLISREDAMEWVVKYDGLFPKVYAGVTIEDILINIGMTEKELYKIIGQYQCSQSA